MIHVFNFARDACAFPGKACLAFAEGCESLEASCSGPFQQCADEAGRICTRTGDFFTEFADRPLSTYVIIKVVLSLAGLRACFNALQEPALGSCEASGAVGIKTWLHIQMGFACLNIFFAPYFQSQVWQVLLQESAKIAPSIRGQIHIPAAKVHESFRLVILHDVPVCLYAAALLLSFSWSCMAVGMVSKPGCNSGGWAAQACNLGMYFFWVALIYTACYFYCGCCASSVVLSKPAASEAAPAREFPNEIPVPSAPPLEGFPPQPSAAKQPACLAEAVPATSAGAAPGFAPRRPALEQGHAQPVGCWTTTSCICAYFVPPVGVFMRFGCSKQFAVCLLLTFLGYAPGIIYACVVIACEGVSEAQAREWNDLEGQDYYIAVK